MQGKGSGESSCVSAHLAVTGVCGIYQQLLVQRKQRGLKSFQCCTEFVGTEIEPNPAATLPSPKNTACLLFEPFCPPSHKAEDIFP